MSCRSTKCASKKRILTDPSTLPRAAVAYKAEVQEFEPTVLKPTLTISVSRL